MAHPCYICNYEPVPDGEGVECPHCHRLQYGTTCPHCGQNAPTILRGLKVYCSACHNVRGPLTSGVPLNVVGKPGHLGSTVAKIAGVGTIAITAAVALMVGLLTGAIAALAGAANPTTWGLLAALLIALVGGSAGGLMLLGSKKLRERSERAQRHARESAIFALAANRGGLLTAFEVAQALDIPLAEADGILTQMAREGTRVGIEVDGQGRLYYIFHEAQRQFGTSATQGIADMPSTATAPTGIRVDVQDTTTEPSKQERIREQVDREFERLQRIHKKEREGR